MSSPGLFSVAFTRASRSRMRAVRAAGRVVLAPTIQSRTICHARGGECAVKVHAVAIECRRLSPAVKRPVNTRPVKRRQSFVRQSVVLLNSNLGFLSRPWIFHLAAPLVNRSPRTPLLHNKPVLMADSGPRRSPPVPDLPSQRLTRKSGEGVPRYGGPAPNATKIDRNRPPQNSGFEERSVMTGSTYISQLKVV